MEKTLSALGDILLKAIPTFFLVLLLYVYLRRMFFGPMGKLLAERREATEGARRRAAEILRQVEQKTGQYEAHLQAARAEIFREQERERGRSQETLEARLGEARRAAQAQAGAARAAIAVEAAAARQSIEAQSAVLADQVLRAVLGKGAAA